MNLNLSQIGFLLLLITASARVLLISVPLVKFVRIFDRKIVEGGRLIGELEIPGLKRFIRHEVILGFTPSMHLPKISCPVLRFHSPWAQSFA